MTGNTTPDYNKSDINTTMQLNSPIHNYLQTVAGLSSRHVINAIVQPPTEPKSIDELIKATIEECNKLPQSFNLYMQQVNELYSRLAYGRLHLSVVGEFNRGKSTFINSLIGMPLLPTSVLPITTVPTRIIYGAELSCTIRFFNNKPDIVIRTSQEKITRALLTYVAEEFNPQNQYSVDSVEVCVPSPLLENGTVLIDTPGFGSTYLHNTKAALDSLVNCDAALFLLSADPPMTQTEVEFLKRVAYHVPRLFFILNKVDLLTSLQLKKVDSFISDILMSQLRHTEKPHLFHICARMAEQAQTQTLHDPKWAHSGMEAVRDDIINFLANEKYFTLSQALNDTLKDTINSITGILIQQKSECEAPTFAFNKERDILREQNDLVNKQLDKERSLLKAEQKAVLKFMGEQLNTMKPKLTRQVKDALSILLDSSVCDKRSLKGVSLALQKIIPEALSAFTSKLVVNINRPINKAVMLHGKEFERLELQVFDCISGSGGRENARISEKLESFELNAEQLPNNSEELATFNYSLQWNDVFFNRLSKIRRLHNRNDHKLDDLLNSYFFSFTNELRQKTDDLFNQLDELLSKEYRCLSKMITDLIHRKEQAIVEQINKSNRVTTTLTTRIEAFKQILVHLH